MEPSELETNIGELESRVERLRSLYEQYFCGIEKLEPQIPRKDVDRRIHDIRKIQIRNTAMRFKFQTIIQRYSTLQNHWGRVLREIENGTYRRDLVKAAARFGVDDALAAAGKKKGTKLAEALTDQIEREGRRKTSRARPEADSYEEVDPALVESVADDDDDDAPTPPPQHVRRGGTGEMGAPTAADHAAYAAQQAAYASQAPVASPSQYPAAASSHPHYDQQQREYAQQQQAYYAQQQAYELQQRQAAARAAANAAPPEQSYSEASQPGDLRGAGAPVVEKKKGGLRLGGGPKRGANAEALNRIASLVGGGDTTASPPAVSETSVEAPPPSGGRRPLLSSPLDIDVGAARAEPVGRKPLLSSPLDIEVSGGPEPLPPSKPAAPSPPPPRVSSGLGLKRPTTSRVTPEGRSSAPEITIHPSPAEVQRASRPAEVARVTPAPAAAPKAEAPDPPQPDAGVSARPRPAERARPAAASPSSARSENLSDGRLREIYSQYVQARRDRNESTAGLTFEKLSDTLRSQADKLKEKHSAKRVDYEVVVKEGKTVIKPIVR